MSGIEFNKVIRYFEIGLLEMGFDKNDGEYIFPDFLTPIRIKILGDHYLTPNYHINIIYTVMTRHLTKGYEISYQTDRFNRTYEQEKKYINDIIIYVKNIDVLKEHIRRKKLNKIKNIITTNHENTI